MGEEREGIAQALVQSERERVEGVFLDGDSVAWAG